MSGYGGGYYTFTESNPDTGDGGGSYSSDTDPFTNTAAYDQYIQNVQNLVTQDHHILPQQFANSTVPGTADPLIQMLSNMTNPTTGQTYFNIDSPDNIIPIPQSKVDAAALVPPTTNHYGRTLSSYNQVFQDFLDGLKDTSDYATLTDPNASADARNAAAENLTDKISDFTDTAGEAIAQGNLYTNNPLSSSGIDANDVNKAYSAPDPVTGEPYYEQFAQQNANEIAQRNAQANSDQGDADAGAGNLEDDINNLLDNGNLPTSEPGGGGGSGGGGETGGGAAGAAADEASVLTAEGALAGGLEALGLIGLGVIAYQAGTQIGDAINDFESGNYTAGEQTLTNLAGSLAGGFAGAEAGGALGAEIGLALGGPIGALLGGAAGGILGFTGGAAAGQELANSLFNFFNNLGSNLNNALQGAEGLPSAIKNALNNLFHARHDPLIIDLTGNGLNIEASSSIDAPYFDFSGGNFAVKTAWTGTGNGFLVIKSTNPAYGISIGNGYELLGTGAAAGFALLQSLVASGAPAIDASNPNYALLAVWQDGNGDGIADAGEILSLQQLGIISISVNALGTNQTINDSTVQEVSTVTFANGNRTTIGQVDLGYNPVDTKYTGSFTEDKLVAELPNVKGFGDVPNLAIAMSLNPTLATMVQEFSESSPTTQTALDQSVQAILYEWAGVSSVSPAAGNIFDGQKVDFLADFTQYQTPFSTDPSAGPAPWFIGQAISLNGTWNQIFDMVEAQFLVDVNAAFYNAFTYAPTAGDTILPDSDDLATALQSLKPGAPSDPIAALNYWVEALLVANESASDILRVQDAVGASNTAYTLKQAGDPTLAAIFPSYFSADILAAALSGTLTYVEMSALNNVVYGTAGADLYDVSTPNQKIIGFGGGDEIIVNPGAANLEINEVENNPSNTNVLFFAPGITKSDITVGDDTNGDLIITYDAQGDQVTLDNMVFGPTVGSEQGPLHTSLPYTPSTEFGVQEVIFADGTTLSAQELLSMLQTNGSPTDPVLDSGDASETLDPRGYAHTIIGTGGMDTIVYNTNYGDLSIDETNSSGAEQSVLTFGGTITLADIAVGADGAGDLLISLPATGGTITLTGMDGSNTAGIAQAVFADGSSITAAALLELAATGEPGNTTLFANNVATTYDPAGYAHSVNGVGAGDTVIYNQGYGNLTITPNSNSPGVTLAFGSQITEADISVAENAAYDMVFTDLATGSTIVVTGGDAPGAVTFTDGTTLTAAQLTAMADSGGVHNIAIYSLEGNTINTNGVADYVQGNGNGDVILYDLGYGNLTIYEQGAAGLFGPGALYATLQFGPGITESEISVSADSQNDVLLEIGTTGAVITLQNMLQFDAGGFFSSNDGVSAITFTDGTTYSPQQIIGLSAIGSAFNTTIYGAVLDTTIDPAGFAHVIDGTGNASTILYNTNDGDLLIEETPYGASGGTLQLGASISESTVSVEYAGTSYYGEQQDVVLSIAAGAEVTIDGAAQLSTVAFADGTVWDTATLLALADIALPGEAALVSDASTNLFDPKGYAHTIITGYYENESDTIVFNAGYGLLAVNEEYGNSQTTIEFGAGISESEISAAILGNNTLALAIGTTGDEILFDGFSQLSALTFADGTTWVPSVVLALADIGSSLTSTLSSDSTQNLFNPNGFAHLINAGYNETDTVVYDAGDGDLTINEGNSSTTTIEFGTGFSAASITAENVSNDYIGVTDLVLNTGTPGDSITINGAGQLAGLTFADGTSLSVAAILALADVAAPGETVLTGDSTTNLFNPNGFAQYIENYGGQGNDTILYNIGDGDLTINDDTAYFDTYNSVTSQYQYGYLQNNNILQFGSGITAGEITASQGYDGSLLLTVGNGGPVITLDEEAEDAPRDGTSQAPQYGVASAVFADGTTLSAQQLITMADASSPANTVLYAGVPTTFVASPYLQQIYGSGGADVIDYGTQSGDLAISEYGPYGTTAASVLQFGTGISESDVEITQDGNGDVLLKIVPNGTTITLGGMVDSILYPGDTSNGISAAIFADGTTWSASYILSQLLIPSTFNTNLYAYSSGNTFNSEGLANFIDDQAGPNTYIYNAGYGTLSIAQFSNNGSPAQSVLQFGAGVTAADLTVSVVNTTDIAITDGVVGDEIILSDMAESTYAGIGTVNFVDGSSLTAAQLIAASATGSVGNTTLYSDYSDDTLNPNGFAHFIADNGADEILYGTA